MSHDRDRMIAVTAALGIVTAQFQALLERRLTAFDLTPPQLNVLSHIARHGPCRVTDIARAVEVGQPAVTKMVTKFERLGWLEQRPDDTDRRVRAVALTPGGFAHLGRIQGGLMPELPAQLAAFSPDDLDQLTLLLRRMMGALDAMRRLDDRH